MKINMKYFLMFGGFMLVVILVMIFLDTAYLERYYIFQNEKNMRNVGEEIAEAYHGELDQVKQYIRDTDETWNFVIRIAQADGQLVYDARPGMDANAGLDPSTLSRIRENREQLQAGEALQYTDMVEKWARIVYIRQIGDLYLVMQKSLNSINQTIDITNQFLLICGCCLIVVGLGVTYVGTRNMTRRIVRISKRAERIAQMDFSERIPVTSKDEISSLAQSINEMSYQLDSSIRNLQEDIDKRRQLVRNMAHELKTPVAAVKGYAEGLQFGVANTPEKIQTYCAVIVEECDRIDDLVQKMLLLAKTDTVGQPGIVRQAVTAEELIQMLQNRFQLKEQEKEIRGEQYYDEACANLYGDKELLFQALSNYLDNAIRYCTYGGVIRLEIREQKDRIDFTVYNEGSPIPEEELPKLWDAFYRVDQSRTRGGTRNYGIGLAIVNSVAHAHGGDVFVKNEENGVVFGFWIPKTQAAVRSD